MRRYRMIDIIPLLSMPDPGDKSSYYIQCPCCDTGRSKHLNVDFVKDVFRCPRCGFAGGIFDFYAFFAHVDRDKVKETLDSIFAQHGMAPRSMSAKRRDKAHTAPARSIECPLIDVETRDRTYRALLNEMSLASDHYANLHGRGLKDEAIEKYWFRSTPRAGHQKIAQKLLSEGHYLAGVPGFYRNSQGVWTMVNLKRGIVFPSMDLDGRFQGLKIRLDNVKRRKFRAVSSRNMQDGTASHAWIHIVGPIQEEIILIEGEMKADIVHELTGQTVIAVPGVNALKELEEVLKLLWQCGVRRIKTAFDMDYLNNWHVRDGYWNLIHLIDGIGFKFGTYLWSPDYNGLDDFVWEFLMNRCWAA